MNSKLFVATIWFLFFLMSAGAAHSRELSIGPLFDPAVVEEAGADEPGFGRADIYFLQDEEEALEEEWDYPPRRFPDFGWYVGTGLMTLNLNMTVFEPMTSDRDIDDFSTRVILMGPMVGMIYKDLRVGVAIIAGDQHQSSLVDNKRRNAFISFTGYGVNIEYSHMIERRYARRVPYLRVGYLGGILAGAGQLYLHASGLDLVEQKWRSTTSIPFVNPYVGVWLSPFDWLWFQYEMGWMMPTWDTEDPKYENDAGDMMVDGEITGGLQIGIKIVVGQNPNIYYEPPETEPGYEPGYQGLFR